MRNSEQPTRLFDLFDDNKQTKKRRNTNDTPRQCDLVSYALLHRGLRRGEHIVLDGGSDEERTAVAMGVMQAGGIVVMPKEKIPENPYSQIFTINSKSLSELFEHGRLHANPELLNERRNHATQDDVCAIVHSKEGKNKEFTHKQLLSRIKQPTTNTLLKQIADC